MEGMASRGGDGRRGEKIGRGDRGMGSRGGECLGGGDG